MVTQYKVLDLLLRGASRLQLQHRLLPAEAKTFLILILICVSSLGGVFAWKAWKVHKAQQEKSTLENNKCTSSS